MNHTEPCSVCRGQAQPIRVSGIDLRHACARGMHTPDANEISGTCCEQKMHCAGTRVEQGAPLAMAYVPEQIFCGLYDPCTALIAGTLFEALDKPFCGETISASAYPTPPARACSCGCRSAARGGHHHD